MKMTEMQNFLAEIAGPREGRHRPPGMKEQLARHIVNSKTTLLPHDRHHFEEVCEFIDNEKDGEEAWWLVEHHKEVNQKLTPKYFKEALKGASSNVGPATVAYMLESGNEPATGVLIEICNRIFVATTRHSVPARPEGKIVMVGPTQRKMELSRPSIPAYGFSSEREDVAFFEIEEGFLKSNLAGRAPIPLTRVKPSGVGKPNHVTCLSGYPSDAFRIWKTGPINLIEVQPHFWSIPEVVMPDDWQAIPGAQGSPDPNPEIDLFLYYDVNSDVLCDGNPVSNSLPSPKGFSGGGIWQPSRSDRRVWIPDYSLIAIQSAWPGDGAFLRATQIIHWLRLMWLKCPELRDELFQHHPTLGEASGQGSGPFVAP